MKKVNDGSDLIEKLKVLERALESPASKRRWNSRKAYINGLKKKFQETE